MLDLSWQVCCRGTATRFDVIAMPQRKKWKAFLSLRSFDVDKESARTAARKKWKNGPCAPLRVLSDENFPSLWPTGAFMRRLGTANIVQLAFSSVDLDRDLPAEEIAGVEWCSDSLVSLLEELKIVIFLCTDQDCVEKIVIAPPKKQPADNRDGASLYFLLSSTFLWCCNVQISALKLTLSGCLLSISFDFTPFPVKLISARTRIRNYTCCCISPRSGDALKSERVEYVKMIAKQNMPQSM